MFKNYLKVIFRNFKKQRTSSIINIVGLSIGLTSAIIVLLIVKREYAVNRNFSHADRLYRVSSDWKVEGMGSPISTLAPVGPLLQGSFPEVEFSNRFWGGWVVLNVGEKAFREDMLLADPSFFQLFDLPFLAGDPATAFQQPNSVVITEGLAYKCFGTTEVLGRSITFQTWRGEGKRGYKVTGVLKKLPRTSVTHFSEEGFAVFISTRNLKDFLDPRGFESWDSRYIVTYILLQPGANVNALQARLPALLDEHCPEGLRPNIELKLEPITKIHLTDFGGQVQKTIKGYILFAVLMIVIACINFINLSTARAAQRAKEIGVRKVLGSARLELVKQFLTEALVCTSLALLMSLGLVEIFIRLFRDTTARGIEFNFLAQGDVLVMLLGLTLLTGILAGAYPAFFLSAFRPVQAIRGGLRSGKGVTVIRKVMVVAQFIATVFLLIAATVISRQLHFMMNRDLGFDRENVLVIQSVPREWNFNGVKKQEVLKQALLRIPEISAATLSFDVPADYGSGSLELTTPFLPQGHTVTATQFTVDESFLKTFNLQLAAGRFFSKEFFHADTANAIVLNQTAVEALALQNPVGEMVKISGDHDFHVIGVVENFSFFPLERDDKPLAFLYVYAVPIYRYLSLKLRSEDMAGTIARVKSVWDGVYADVPFEYQFVDQVVQLQYGKIEKMQTVSGYATVLAILVACLGLFGLVVFAAEQRTKEIGIRKVLGATVANVTALLSKDFIKLVLLANLLAWPVAWFAMNKWLQNFAYRIEISWWVFVLAGGLALVIALVTVSTQAVRAALANPVESLRYE